MAESYIPATRKINCNLEKLHMQSETDALCFVGDIYIRKKTYQSIERPTPPPKKNLHYKPHEFKNLKLKNLWWEEIDMLNC